MTIAPADPGEAPDPPSWTLVIWIGIATLVALGVVIAVLAIGGRPDPSAPRAAAVLLDGPWRFRTGDDPRWANAALDDSGWETMDLTAPASSHDGDVGLPNYVKGWMAHGHPGYRGYAWYRRIVTVPAGNRAWDVLGPTAVDHGYELYWNGVRLGGLGRLGPSPRMVGIRPMIFALPADAAGARGVLAIRVLMLPGRGPGGDAGGIHVAPTLAPRPASQSLYRAQWRRTIAGYVVDAVEPLAMFALAGLALAGRSRSSRPGFITLTCVALALSAVKRLDNAIVSWTDLMSLPTYGWLIHVLMPLGLGAWALAWNRWSSRPSRLIDGVALALTVAGLAGGLMHVEAMTQIHRFGLLALLALIAVRMVRDGPMRVMASATMAMILVAQFADELGAIGVPGIWFPFGIGVSRTQYAYAVAIPLLALLIARTIQAPSVRVSARPSPAAEPLESL